ncbi:hypothetical protein RUM43_007440 [Polyplax serrata]|uniref:Protein-lysine N-methyltransferase RUM43_007440 n=1 Tax=Polyplax serrata TaxID=468196 RepID=A0AAN8P8J5_POLSC
MDGELNSSILGSYEFWNNLYNDEIENFQNHGDVGEIWFGKETVKRIVKWISENPLIKKNDSILDLGCGNGMFLVELFKVGFNNLHGVDYSKNAIDLAEGVSDREDCCINFFVGNILDDIFESNYSVCLDKGTYDAISLDPEDAKFKRQTYIENISKLLAEDLEMVEVIPAPVFKFGGKTGKTVNTVVFKKKQSTEC